MFGENKVVECWSRRRRKRNIAAPATAPTLGATMYIHMFLNFHDRIAGPNDLAGFMDPPETGLQPITKTLTLQNKTMLAFSFTLID